jgi:protease PrsW
MRTIVQRGWFQIGLGGVALFILTDIVLQYTQNPNYLPSFIMLGAFIVPVAFFAYFYRQESLLDRDIHGRISLIMAAVVFLVGGMVGTVVAGLLEDLLNFNSDWATLLSVGGIEEASKLIFPVAIFILFSRYRSEIDGLVFGIAAGIGFAALETMGYGLQTLLAPGAQLSDLDEVLAIRGLMAPLGHAAWTGLICGAISHYQGQGKKLVYMAAGAFLLAAILHFLWDMVASVGAAYIVYPSFLIIGAVGLFFVFRHLHHARQKSLAPHDELSIPANNEID